MRIKILLLGWLLLHPVVRAAAISVDSVWLAMDSLSIARLARVAAQQCTDTVTAFKEAWETQCRRRLEQGLSRTAEGASTDSCETLRAAVRSVWCCHLFHAIPQSASRSRLMKERERVSAWRQSLVVNSDPLGDERLHIDTCWMLPGRQPEELEQALDTLPLDAWSEPLVTAMGIHLLKVLVRDALFLPIPQRMADSRLEQLKAKHDYQPQQEMIDRLRKGMLSEEGVLFYVDQHPYTLATFRLFAASRRSAPQHCFDAFVKKSLLDAEAQALFAGERSQRELLATRDSLMIHHLLMKEVYPRLHDEEALEAWYQAHAAQFRRPTFRGLVLHCMDKEQGRALRKFLKPLPESERRRALEQVFANQPAEAPEVEEGVFFEGSNPYVDALCFRKAAVEPHPQRPYIQLVGRKTKGPEHYQEVRQEVLNGYQLELIHRLLLSADEGGNVEN